MQWDFMKMWNPCMKVKYSHKALHEWIWKIRRWQWQCLGITLEYQMNAMYQNTYESLTNAPKQNSHFSPIIWIMMDTQRGINNLVTILSYWISVVVTCLLQKDSCRNWNKKEKVPHNGKIKREFLRLPKKSTWISA